MATLQDNYQPGVVDQFASLQWRHKGQSFTASSSYTINQITLRLWKTGTASSRSYSVYLYAADVDGLPIGSPLATFGTFSQDDLTTTPSNYNFTSDSYSVTSGNTYCIVVSALLTSATSSELYWGTTTGNGYANGNASYISGFSGWFADADKDRWFALYTDDVPPPTKPTNPTPSNGATEVDFSGFQLSWDDGGGADTFNIYIGESGNLTPILPAQAGTTYTTSLAELESIFSQSPIDQVIYWRVDATNDEGTTTGDEWNFDARPGKASNPSPTNAATNENLAQTLTWDAVAYTDTYSLYINTGSGLSLEDDTLTSGTYTPSNFEYITSITWRVDTVNQFGTTIGDEWTFTTLRFYPPAVTYFYNGEYYKLFPGGSHPYDGGVEDTDYVVVTYLPNFIRTNSIVVACAANTFWYEDK